MANRNGNGRKKPTAKAKGRPMRFPRAGIQQGVVTSVPVSYRAGPGRRFRGPKGRVASMRMRRALNAIDPTHLALPRAIGPYSTIRLTKNLTFTGDNERFLIFGTFRAPSNTNDLEWTDTIAYRNDTGFGNSVGAVGGAYREINGLTSLTGLQNARLVPAAFSIQVMCPQSMQTAEGMVQIGRWLNVPDLKDNSGSRTWADLYTQWLSFSNPRQCAAGKLALRGVHVDAIPYNMSALASFEEITSKGEGTFQLIDSVQETFAGFAPIGVYKPASTDLQILVTVEYRVRFDPSNPAYATHKQHPIASDAVWQRVIGQMSSEGHGAKDIAEVIASGG